MHPVLFAWGSFKLYTYGVLVAAGVLLGLFVARKRAAALGLDPERIWRLGVYGVLAALAGAKLWLLFAEWQYYSQHLREIFSIRTLLTGGAFYGALAGGTLFLILYGRLNRLDGKLVLDIFAPGTALGQGIGRLGCFAAGCCYGKPTRAPWGVTFTNPIATDIAGTPLGNALHPAQLYESGCDFLIFLFLLWLARHQRFTGELFAAYAILYGVARGIIEFFRGDPDRTLLAGGAFSLMQVASLFLVGVGIWMFVQLGQKISWPRFPTSWSSVDKKNFVVGKEDSGERLDRYVAARLPEISRTRLQELIADGSLLVNGGAAKRSHQVREGDKIEVLPSDRPPAAATPENIPLAIVYEDNDVIVVNKPAGMLVHAGAGQSHGTLVNALLHYRTQLSTTGGGLRPGIVHRLDRGTSGTLIVARSDRAHQNLADQFRARKIEKRYIALVHGKLERDAGRIELAIARDPRRRTRMTARRAGALSRARDARTDWRVLARLDGFTLVEVDLHTGRTHQIRVHFSTLGHPIVGDSLYGAPKRVRAGKEALPALERNFLHAARIGFTQPSSGEWVLVQAPLPEELRCFLEKLAGSQPDAGVKIDAALRPYL